ncbi:MAG: hypothetical protein ABSD53_18830 [Terriglobales bacterium]|jgi:hypothetical protein
MLRIELRLYVEALLFKNSWMSLRAMDEMLQSFQYGSSHARRTAA